VSTIHASAVLIGARAALIRGPAGAGKSRFVLALLQAGTQGILPFTRLVCDDRAHVEAVHGRLLVRPASALAGLLEVRGLGLRQLPHEPAAVVGWVVDLAENDAARMPSAAGTLTLEGVTLPHLAVRPCADPLLMLVAAIRTDPARQGPRDATLAATQHSNHSPKVPLQ
jgi:HPr kinase/phosphorylase